MYHDMLKQNKSIIDAYKKMQENKPNQPKEAVPQKPFPRPLTDEEMQNG
jgi:hypothetical protein